MKRLTKLTGLSVLVLSFALVMSFVASETTYAQENTQQPQTENNQNQEAAPEVVYEYIAQPGDSYSLLARKAVQTYGLKEKVDLSLAQVIFAETNLTNAAGASELNVGQEVAIKESDVKSWVDKAKNLSSDVQAAWDYYTQFADFNTDNVGESS